MRVTEVITAVDSHTEGMATRVVTSGIPTLRGSTMAERRDYMTQYADHFRSMLVNEPRGHAAMTGAILQPPARPEADWGVLFIEASGVLPMCGHGTMGVATVLVEMGMVDVSEPITTCHLDTPAGLVDANVQVRDGKALSVTIENVPSFVESLDRAVDVNGIGAVNYDMVYGGNFFAIVPVDEYEARTHECLTHTDLLPLAVRVMTAINEQARPVHPLDQAVAGCHHVQFVRSVDPSPSAAAAVVNWPGWFDRSPCGTGTCARMAQLHARGYLTVGEEYVSRSIIGTEFIGRIAAETTVAMHPAVIAQITGRAWITGIGQYLLDPSDPFPDGFELEDAASRPFAALGAEHHAPTAPTA